MVGLGVGPPCLRVDSEETLLTVIDERAQLAHAAPGVTPVDSSEEGAPVPELIKLSVLGEPLVDSLQEPMPAAEQLEYAIQATALIWEPLEQVCYVVSDNVDFDSFGMAPWDAGGIHGDICEAFQTMMLQWLMRLLCRQAIMNGLNGTMRINTEYGLVRSLMTNTDSPRLAVTAVDLIFRRTSFPPYDLSFESEFQTSKMADRSEMARNAIKSDFRTSKMSTGGHFVKNSKNKFRIDLKWPELRSKVNFGHPKWPMAAILSKISK